MLKVLDVWFKIISKQFNTGWPPNREEREKREKDGDLTQSGKKREFEMFIGKIIFNEQSTSLNLQNY